MSVLFVERGEYEGDSDRLNLCVSFWVSGCFSSQFCSSPGQSIQEAAYTGDSDRVKTVELFFLDSRASFATAQDRTSKKRTHAESAFECRPLSATSSSGLQLDLGFGAASCESGQSPAGSSSSVTFPAGERTAGLQLQRMVGPESTSADVPPAMQASCSSEEASSLALEYRT